MQERDKNIKRLQGVGWGGCCGVVPGGAEKSLISV
jgi:hypothetical protein